MAKGRGNACYRSDEDALVGLDHQCHTHEQTMLLGLEATRPKRKAQDEVCSAW